MASHFFEVGRRFGRELRQYDVPAILRGRVRIRFESFKREDLCAALNQSLGKQKSCGQLEIVAGCAHRDAQWIVADANFQRLLSREIVFLAAERAVVPLG